MRPNPQFPADLVTFTEEEILHGKIPFLCSDVWQSPNCISDCFVECKFRKFGKFPRKPPK